MGAIFPVFGFDVSAKSANVTAQSRVNLYAELKLEKDKTGLVLYRTPGTTLFNGANGGANPYRGVSKPIGSGDLWYGVKAGTFYEINNAGVETSRGTINTTSGNVCITDNGKQVLIVDGTNGYIYTIATTTLTQIASANFPNGATTCDFIGGFFLVDDPNNNGRFYKSASYDGTTWASTDFATAESNPDALVRVFVNQAIAHLLGKVTTEFWYLSGALDFPFSPIQGSTIEWGLAAKWSLAKMGGRTTFLAQNIEGHVQVVRLNGFQPEPISTPELESLFDTYTVSDAVAFTYMLGGHEFYEISFVTNNVTWLYDATTSAMAGIPVWSQLKSGSGRHVAQFYVNFQNRNLVTDYSTGNIYELKDSVYTDNGTMIQWLLRSKHVAQETNNVSVGRLWVDMETGVGLATGQGSNPQVAMRYSKDGGHTWSAELWRSLGAMGKYLTRLLWLRLGAARDWVFELSGSDPVKIAILNAGLVIKKK